MVLASAPSEAPRVCRESRRERVTGSAGRRSPANGPLRPTVIRLRPPHTRNDQGVERGSGRAGRRMKIVDCHPAGFDLDLAKVLDDVRAGRWRSMRALLEATGERWGLRTSRTQVLAVAAARSDAVEAWGRESRDPQFRVMRARVLVERTLRAHREGRRNAFDLANKARTACETAATLAPADPVPYVAWLALAQIDSPLREERQPENKMTYTEGLYLFPAGPWGLLNEVRARDPFNREAWHRALQALSAYGTGALDYASWAASLAASHHSDVTLLPIYAHVQLYRAMRERGQEAESYWGTRGASPSYWWTGGGTSYYAQQALGAWFWHADRTTWSPLDLNHLAMALHYGGQTARAVFEAIGTYATRAPWEYLAEPGRTWQDEFLQARHLQLVVTFRGQPAMRDPR